MLLAAQHLAHQVQWHEHGFTPSYCLLGAGKTPHTVGCTLSPDAKVIYFASQRLFCSILSAYAQEGTVPWPVYVRHLAMEVHVGNLSRPDQQSQGTPSLACSCSIIWCPLKHRVFQVHSGVVSTTAVPNCNFCDDGHGGCESSAPVLY